MIKPGRGVDSGPIIDVPATSDESRAGFSNGDGDVMRLISRAVDRLATWQTGFVIAVSLRRPPSRTRCSHRAMERADAGSQRWSGSSDRDTLLQRFCAVRAASLEVAGLFSPEDQLLQAMPEASPVKWHLAHTSWFFETFVLRGRSEYEPLDERYEALFNSYYNAVGPQARRSERGLWSRPSLAEVASYRRHVDAAIVTSYEHLDALALKRLELGLHHEQQHQELMLTDTLAALAKNPLQPAAVPFSQGANSFRPGRPLLAGRDFQTFEGGLFQLGHEGSGFHFDNEGPPNTVFVPAFSLASRPLTNSDVVQFIEAGGYRRPELWLSDGFDWVTAHGIELPCYWRRAQAGYEQYTLCGSLKVDPDRTACHLSYFEADALARFFEARLPTEVEWEFAARSYERERSPVEAQREHWFSTSSLLPDVPPDGALSQLFGTTWEWTSSPYTAYSGFRPAAGAIGEYNGKFMHGQMVLRGGSLATPVGHFRPTYRNFFPAAAQWQFSGVRLARDVR